MFDPYHIFKRKVHSSHAGQVLRKKNLGNNPPQAYTQSDITESENLLKSLGYSIYPPRTPSYPDFLIDRVYHWELELGETHSNSYIPTFVRIDDIWPRVKDAYAEIFKYDPSRIKAFQFSISVNSYKLYGTLTQSPNTNANRLTFQIPLPTVTTDLDSVQSWNIGSITPASSTNEGLYTINQFNSSYYLTYACFDRNDARTARDLNMTAKSPAWEYTQNLFLLTYNDVDLYKKLLSGNFPNSYNHTLIGYVMPSGSTSDSFTASNSMIGVTLWQNVKARLW